jgi:hypothetical protein
MTADTKTGDSDDEIRVARRAWKENLETIHENAYQLRISGGSYRNGGYETGDSNNDDLTASDDEADADSFGSDDELQVRVRDDPWWWILLAGTMKMVASIVIVLLALSLLVFTLDALSTELKQQATAMTDDAPCFISNTLEDTWTPLSASCVQATAGIVRWEPCPRGAFAAVEIWCHALSMVSMPLAPRTMACHADCPQRRPKRLMRS